MQAIGQQVLRAVREMKSGSATDNASLEQMRQIPVPGDLAQADDHANLPQRDDLVRKMAGAVADLLRKRFVAGRSTTDDGRDPGVTELEAVISGNGMRLIRKSKFVQDGIHEVTRAVACEGPARAICPVSPRCQAQDEDACLGVTKTGNRPRPVDMVLVGAAADLADALAVIAQPRAAFTVDDGRACRIGRELIRPDKRVGDLGE